MKYVRGVKRVTKPSSTLCVCVLCATNSVSALGAVVGMARQASTKAIATLHKSTAGGRKRMLSEYSKAAQRVRGTCQLQLLPYTVSTS